MEEERDFLVFPEWKEYFSDNLEECLKKYLGINHEGFLHMYIKYCEDELRKKILR